MAPKNNRPYIIIDSNAWVTFFSYRSSPSDLRKDALVSEQQQIADNVAALIDEHGKKHLIVMPTAIYVELLGILRGKGNTPASRKRVVDEVISFLESIDFLFVDLDEQIARESEALITKHDSTGIDASILASTSYWEARHVYTCDGGILKVADRIPGVLVDRPPEPHTLQYHLPNVDDERF